MELICRHRCGGWEVISWWGEFARQSSKISPARRGSGVSDASDVSKYRLDLLSRAAGNLRLERHDGNLVPSARPAASYEGVGFLKGKQTVCTRTVRIPQGGVSSPYM